MTKEQFIARALRKSQEPGDYWANVVKIASQRKGISIFHRGEYSQKQWNWLEQACSKLWEPGD